jgi:hypothetical protein
VSDLSLFYWQEKLGKTQPRILRLGFQITAAKTVSPLVQGVPALTTFDAFASQAVIDGFLGTTNEFLLAAFDATSMGNDTFGGLINMGGANGQVYKLLAFDAKCYSGTGGSTLVERHVQSSAALTASTLASEAAVGASGNLGFKVDFGNTPDFDGLTSGMIQLEFQWISK